ncbi:hypothetical protein GCM10010530_50720 [Kribbella aluminosa]
MPANGTSPNVIDEVELLPAVTDKRAPPSFAEMTAPVATTPLAVVKRVVLRPTIAREFEPQPSEPTRHTYRPPAQQYTPRRQHPAVTAPGRDSTRP